MSSISRRSFMGGAAAGFAALATPAIAASQTPLLFKEGDWKMASFQHLLTQSYEAKQLFDTTNVDGGGVFDHMVNSLNGLQFGFGIPAEKIKIVGAFRAQASVLNFNDSLWEKYRIGELVKIKDHNTGKWATRNIFVTSPAGNPPKYVSNDPENENSSFGDSSIQALQARGVQLLACHIALYYVANRMSKRLKLKQSAEEIREDISANLLPGVIIVPSMVSAIVMLQSKGHFTYLRM